MEIISRIIENMPRIVEALKPLFDSPIGWLLLLVVITVVLAVLSLIKRILGLLLWPLRRRRRNRRPVIYFDW
ncbi:MAG: hypothetical protein HXX08_13575 [Chloroflexi bacterium]|uniref:Uncharacterized protein n=1 Tax=Candidatus Chlorohelix allophototropha TaxID=3003348 RepID=A0A8T7M479_9CHLR|nr:hypothetical protein [Chloroflexota bacterium]WJW70120.1 hypothetical protein OZ401_004623 [Chloroflexota bacterium L227-S17]